MDYYNNICLCQMVMFILYTTILEQSPRVSTQEIAFTWEMLMITRLNITIAVMQLAESDPGSPWPMHQHLFPNSPFDG